MWNNSLRELWNIAPFGRNVKWNLPTFASANISHLRSKYFTAKLFHLPAGQISLKKAHICPVDKCVLFSGGGWWIRTTEVSDNRFTVCPLWPLGNSPILELVIGVEPTTCWLQISCSAIEPHQQKVRFFVERCLLYHNAFLLSIGFLKNFILFFCKKRTPRKILMFFNKLMFSGVFKF